MTAFSQAGQVPVAAALSANPAELAKRRPQRVTITLPWSTLDRLVQRSGYEGRSLSNLCAHLLEVGTLQ